MTEYLAALADDARKLLADITRLQGKENVVSEQALDQLTRRSQRLAIRCREVQAGHREDDFPSAPVAPTPGGAYPPDWSVAVLASDLVEITLPLLLPKRTCPDATFITEPLEQLLSANQADLPRFRHCYVVFQYLYGPELTVRDVRDHDNTETRKVLNVIERYLLTSDSGIYTTTIHQTARGGRTATVIHLAGSTNHLEGVLRNEIEEGFTDR